VRSQSTRRSTQLSLLILLIFGALVAYSLNLTNYFLSDDFVQIGKVLNGDYSVVWGRETGGFFRPLFIWSYVSDSLIWGARPFGYHLTNVLLHGLNSFLIFRLGRELFSEAAKDAAIAAAILFLLHPSHTEAVSWISGRADLIATCFVLFALTSFLIYLRERRNAQMWVALIAFLMALLAKESAICLPLVAIVLACRRKSETPLKTGVLLKSFSYFVVLLAAFIGMRAYFIGAIVGGYGTSQHLNFAPGWIRDRLLEAAIRSVLPALPESWSTVLFKPLQSGMFYLIVLLCLGSVAAAVIARRKQHDATSRATQNRLLLMLVLSFLFALLPVISLRLSLYETLGERFLYLPTIFSCLLLGYLIVILIRNRTVRVLLLTAVACFYSINVYRTTRVWREAAQLTQRIQNELLTSGQSNHLTILNAPDNLRGVPLFHNGLPEALNFVPSGKPVPRVDIVSFQNLRKTSDHQEVNSSSGLITLRSADNFDRFDRIMSTACVEVVSSEPNTLQLQLKPCDSMADVYFFSDGRVNKLPQN